MMMAHPLCFLHVPLQEEGVPAHGSSIILLLLVSSFLGEVVRRAWGGYEYVDYLSLFLS